MNDNLRMIIFAVVMLIGVFFIVNSQKTGNPLGWAGGGSDAYVTSIVSGTSTVPICKQSIYYPAPTSTDGADDISLTAGTWPWICTTSSDAGGRPLEILSESPRVGFEICQTSADSTTTIWLLRDAMSNSTSSDINQLCTSTDVTTGFQIGYETMGTDSNTINRCFRTHDYGIIWGGKVFILGEGAGTIRYTDFLE